MKLDNKQKIELIDSISDKIVSKNEILKRICEVSHDNHLKIFNSLRRIKKIEYIFQNYYYLNSEEERYKGIKYYSIFELIAVILNKLNVKWYFGLETANDLNKVIWQPSQNIYIINNKYVKKIKIDNQNVIFYKISKELITNLIKHKTKNRILLKISQNKKTLFDFNYFNKKPPLELIEKINKNDERKTN